MMKYFTYLFWVGLAASMSCSSHSSTSIPESHSAEKPPYPLITMGEHFSVQSASPALYDAHLQHSDGQIFPLTGAICVDGQTYRFMGGGERPDVAIAGMSYNEEWTGKYTFVRPSDGWLSADFDDTGWELGKAPFGSLRYHSQAYPKMNTVWPTSAIWVRRKIKVNERDLSGKKLYLKYSHDDEFEFYANGTPIVKTGYCWGENKWAEIPEEVKTAAIRTGEIIVAAHGRSALGESLLDFGIYIPDKAREVRQGKYTTLQPPQGWEQEQFDDTAWDTGNLPLGTPADYRVNTAWSAPEIWVRRNIAIAPEDMEKTLVLRYAHDDVFELYANGVLLVKTGFEWSKDRQIIIPDSIKRAMKGSKLCVAAHCCNKHGGGLVDFYARGEDIARQQAVSVQATQTYYRFECGPVELLLTFTEPQLPNNVALLSRPISYITSHIAARDGKKHEVALEVEMLPMLPPNAAQKEPAEAYEKNNLLLVKQGAPNGGYFYVGTEAANASVEHSGSYVSIRKSLGSVREASATLTLGYENSYAAQYYGETVYPCWSSMGSKTMEQLLAEAHKEYGNAKRECSAFDQTFCDMDEPFGYRSKIAPYSIVTDDRQRLLVFSTNGVADIAATASLLLSRNRELLKAQLNPLLWHAESSKWEKEYAPSGMGAYPLFSGQVSAAFSPVDATSQLLLLLAMLTAAEGNPRYAQEHWPLICRWSHFLQQNRRNTNREAVNRGITAYSYMKEQILRASE